MKPYYEHAGITIYHGDCREILPGLDGDVLLSDPPYGIGYKPRRNCASSGAITGTPWTSQKLHSEVIGDSEPFDPDLVLRFKSVIVWGAHHYASRLPDSDSWFVWDKKRGGSMTKGFIASDADLAWTNLGGCLTKTFSYMWHGLCRDGEVGHHLHPTQKPVALMQWCLQQVKSEFSSVIDPFMGSGTTLVAAKNLGRKAIGIEIEEKYCEIAAKRLAQEVMEFA